MEQNTITRLPFVLKSVAVIMIVSSVASAVLHFGWVWLPFNVAGVLAGLGLLLRKKWAWRVAVAFAALWMVSNIIVLVFSLIFIDESLLIWVRVFLRRCCV